MALSRRPSRTGRSRFTLLLLVLTSITVLTLDFRGSGAVDDLRDAASTAFAPVRDAGAWIGDPISDAWNGVFGYNELESENERLRERVAELEGQRAQAEDVLRQMDEIEELEDVSRWTAIPTVVARVTGNSLSNFQHTVELDKGSDHGLEVGMPVVTGAGLVGRLTQVTSTRSVLQLITDPNWSFGVRLARSGEIGIIHGTGEGEPMVVDEGVELNVDVNRNEAVTTSGYGDSVFPPDIPVGRVAELGQASDQLSQILDVRLLADIDDLSYVRVLQWTPTR
jgi:rod shape-determining protein MreC